MVLRIQDETGIVHAPVRAAGQGVVNLVD